MARYIDINEINFTGAVFEDRDGEIYIKLSDVKQSIEQTPTADVVEVVRCKDCKYGDNGVCVHPENVTHSYDCDDNVYDHYIYVSPEHFCSYGERRDT